MAASTLFNFVEKGPIHPQDLFPGLTGGHDEVVPFNREMVTRIRSLYKTSPVVSTAVGQFVSYVTRAPIVISGSGSELITETLMRELKPVFDQMILEWVLYGYTNITVAKSRRVPGAKIPVVVPFSFVQQSIKWDRSWRVSYEAETTARMGKKKTNISVMCLYPPDEQGHLTTPLAQCVVRLAYAEKLWKTYITGADRSINPTYIFTQQHMGGTTQPGINNLPINASIITSGLGQMPLGDVVATMEKDSAEYVKKMLEVTREQRAEARAIQRAEKEQARAASASDVIFDADLALPTTLRGQLDSDPLTNMYIAPAGQAITSGPDFKTPDDFTRVIELIYEELYRALGLPIIMLQSRGDNSANAEFSTALLNDNVVRFQKKAALLIADVLDMTYGEDIRRSKLDRALTEDIIAIADQNDAHVPTPVDDSKMEVVFMSSPITNFEIAHQAYTSGSITGEAFQDLVLNILNLPESARRPGIDKWLKEQQESGRPPAKRPRQ
ncbi:MAG: hypothetical protein ACOVQN_04290 [Exiguobacterium sp.]